MQESIAVEIDAVSHCYGEHQALKEFSLNVLAGETFALLGPNGSGKSTLFNVISTLLPIQKGDVRIGSQSLSSDVNGMRHQLGVVFQSPSLDPKLTVRENIRCQGILYGLASVELEQRVTDVISQFGLVDRMSQPTEQLSGGLKRRVELAKSLLHTPQLLLMDEPSTGLDPAARIDLWHAIDELKSRSQVTVLMTTHLLEEAERADRVGIVHAGQLVRAGSPSELRSRLSGNVLTIQTKSSDEIQDWLVGQGYQTEELNGQLRVTGDGAIDLMVPLSERFGGKVDTMSVGKPSLEDVFIAETGHRFWDTTQAE